jgi:hypothetical protein
MYSTLLGWSAAAARNGPDLKNNIPVLGGADLTLNSLQHKKDTNNKVQ